MQRTLELDFLKGVFILLMITFHLVYIGQAYPYAKQVVYTFHMPAFLIISGYLMNVGKPWTAFLRSLLGYAVPYVVMESAYIVMASLLPIRDHIDHLTPGGFFCRLLLRPVGPYWYLQTLVACGLSYALVFRLSPAKPVTKLILLGMVYGLLASVAGVTSLACSFYFLAGVAVRQSGVGFSRVFQGSALAVVAFALLAVHPHNLHMDVSGGVLMVYLAVSSVLHAYAHVGGGLRALLLCLGRHTMPLFLFSPLFTFLCKPLAALLSFDPTGMLFLLVSLPLCVCGSLLVGWLVLCVRRCLQ